MGSEKLQGKTRAPRGSFLLEETEKAGKEGDCEERRQEIWMMRVINPQRGKELMRLP
jgi:hypothetical protein